MNGDPKLYRVLENLKIDFEYHEHPAAPVDRLVLDQDVDQRGAIVGNLVVVERPLVALEEDVRGQRGHRIEPRVEKLPLVPAPGIGAEVAGDHLLVGSREVPAGIDGGQAELGLGQVVSLGAGFKKGCVRPHLAPGINGNLIEFPRPAAGKLLPCGFAPSDVRTRKRSRYANSWASQTI